MLQAMGKASTEAGRNQHISSQEGNPCWYWEVNMTESGSGWVKKRHMGLYSLGKESDFASSQVLGASCYNLHAFLPSWLPGEVVSREHE